MDHYTYVDRISGEVVRVQDDPDPDRQYDDEKQRELDGVEEFLSSNLFSRCID